MELLVVMGIIILLVAMAVPMFNAIRGNRSIESAHNQVSAMLGRGRANALGLQQTGGVVFFVDNTGRTQMVVVGDDPRQESPAYIDVIADYDLVALPPGVGLQTLLPSGSETYLCQPAAILFNGNGQLLMDNYAISSTSTLGQLLTQHGVKYNNGVVTLSQLGVLLYDRETFRGMGFNESDQIAGGGATADVSGEEQWLTENSLLLLVNRYNGTLIRTEGK